MLHRRLRLMIETSSEALQNTPRGPPAPNPFISSPHPANWAASGVYLMVDSATGQPLGSTVFHPGMLATVQQNTPNHSPSRSTNITPTSPGRSSCHTHTVDSTEVWERRNLHRIPVSDHVRHPDFLGQASASMLPDVPNETRQFRQPTMCISGIVQGTLGLQESGVGNGHASSEAQGDPADDAPGLAQEATCFLGEKETRREEQESCPVPITDCHSSHERQAQKNCPELYASERTGTCAQVGPHTCIITFPSQYATGNV